MIETENLTKHYGRQAAVTDVSFRCEPGTVTGFLGPNGAGKSTTLRMIAGLTTPSAGRSRVLGVPYAQLPNPGRRVGVLLDASAMHTGRTGRETLAVSARVMGVDSSTVSDLLTQVGLAGAAERKRVRQYSLGMRQRLGIAHAMLGSPEVLILDEPANGLDPDGMRWMRELLRDFADRGGTVLLSSHLLGEIEALADRLVIISDGRIVASGAADELLGAGGTLVRARQEARLRDAIASAGLEARRIDDGGLLVDAEPEKVGTAALLAGVALSELRTADRGGLEQLFIDLTRRSTGDDPAAPSPLETTEPDLMEASR
jgi:ABC-2 type transport system ATP-binding protein